MTEQIIANDIRASAPYFRDIRQRFSGKSREDVTRIGGDYLRQMWNGMGLKYASITNFDVAFQYANSILREIDSVYDSLTKLRHALRDEIAALITQNDFPAVRKMHEDKLKLAKLFCKAQVRAGQWSKLTHEIRNVKGHFRSPESEGRRFKSLSDAVHQANAFDPDPKTTSINAEELFLIAKTSGIVATTVYQNLAKYNVLCEGWGYLYWFKRNRIQAFLHLTPGFVETAVHREAIDDNEEVDRASEQWRRLFAEFRRAGFTPRTFRQLHRLYDRLENFDTPDCGLHVYVV